MSNLKASVSIARSVTYITFCGLFMDSMLKQIKSDIDFLMSE